MLTSLAKFWHCQFNSSSGRARIAFPLAVRLCAFVFIEYLGV